MVAGDVKNVLVKEREKFNYTKAELTASFVGQTTQDGLVVLEHVGYHATPSQKKKGKKGCSIFRFRCPVCGNEEKTGVDNEPQKTWDTQRTVVA